MCKKTGIEYLVILTKKNSLLINDPFLFDTRVFTLPHQQTIDIKIEKKKNREMLKIMSWSLTYM